MAYSLVNVRRSVLDLSVLNDGQSSGEALQTTTALAKRADELGYTRFWVAEHHNMPSVACTSPAVLIAHLAATTSIIRVGSGGVMLPNHAPLVIAEQFAMLAELHPGRIDLGVGRAPGTDQRTAAVLRRSRQPEGEDEFPRDFLDLMGLLGDPRTPTGLWNSFNATPARSAAPDIFLLGSSGYSAQLAGHLGLPFAFAHHFDTGGTMQATELYHHTFQPSVVLEEPYMIVTANVLAADSKEDADWHSAPGRLTSLGRRTGKFIRLPSPQDAATHPDLELANQLPSSRIVGEVSTVIRELEDLVTRTEANELMVTSVAYDLSARIRSIELLAEHWAGSATSQDEKSGTAPRALSERPLGSSHSS